MRNALAQALFTARQKSGFSLAQLAEASGLEVTTIWRIETGKSDPRFTTQLVPLAAALKVSLSALLRQTTKGTQ